MIAWRRAASATLPACSPWSGRGRAADNVVGDDTDAGICDSPAVAKARATGLPRGRWRDLGGTPLRGAGQTEAGGAGAAISLIATGEHSPRSAGRPAS